MRPAILGTSPWCVCRRLCVLAVTRPVPVSTPRAVSRSSGWGRCGGSHGRPRLVLLPLAASHCCRSQCHGCPVVWPGLHPCRCFMVVSVLAPSTLRAVARSGGGGYWAALAVLFPLWHAGLY